MENNNQFNRIPEPIKSYVNPTDEELRQMVSIMPTAKLTEFGNYNVSTKVLARSKSSTFIVSDNPKDYSGQCISCAEAEKVAQKQNEFIEKNEIVIIDGYIGIDITRTPIRLMIEKKYANIAAMQKQLYFSLYDFEKNNFKPELLVIYTPSLQADGFPNNRLIAVDLEAKITRIFNSDYFGESKKAGLRMWNKIIYEKGGLAMHAGCKIIPTKNGDKTLLIIGLSGTGKTTTTFTSQNGSIPIQDDFVALMPNGTCLISENGCFAKTFALDMNSEPTIYHSVTKSNAYLENVSTNENGKIDFFDQSYTQNGRATFPFSSIDPHKNLKNIKNVDYILILNKNQDIMPAVARLNATQAAMYFMLGETMGTSAGGIEEAGKALRIPGTNPFFPLPHSCQGLRFLELIKQQKIQVFLMNTGRVGGNENIKESMKIKIQHSSAIVKAIAENSIDWKIDEDFGYEIAQTIPSLNENDQMLFEPKLFYKKMGEIELYNNLISKLKNERSAYLSKYTELNSLLNLGGNN